ncbi:MAG: carboxypeptidase-like regulatory domain-containing protein [Bacteroidetes bacterium]|nr:carboxypeptidase-like regulatory domain-containing protein [Bacteroidota bacterium]
MRILLTIKIFFFIILIACKTVVSQTYEVNGTISDFKTNKPLEYVTVKVADTAFGTTADRNGKFFIRLKPGGHNLIFSYIGYFSDTSYVLVEDKDITRNIFLRPSEILTESIDVYGEDPAYEIIRRAIKYKKDFKKNLNEYEYNAYSKFVIRSNRSTITSDKDSSASGNKDKLGIFGILESETKGYFKKPDLEKQVVISKKETANITRGFALPLIVNFYDETIDFNEFKIPTPLSDNAFDNYDYRLTGTTSIDSTLIYKISVINQSENIPQLKGTIYIADSIYSLMRVDLYNNDAARPLGINKVNFRQRFSAFEDKKNKGDEFWMPTDIQIFADGSFLGLIKFEAEVFTIVSHYDLNKKAPPGIFDEFVVKVMPDAKKDSSYWKKNQLIKNSAEEKSAYKKIETEDKEKSHTLSLGLTSINYGKRFYANPISFYSFNRVEGNALSFNVNYRAPLNKSNLNSMIKYGFSDKKTKYYIKYSGRFLNDRRLSVNASLFRTLNPMAYDDLLPLQQGYNTLKALFDKRDNLDYFYSSGWNVGLDFKIIPQLTAGINFRQAKQTTAYKNTNYSFRKKEVEFSNNPPINDAFQRTIDLNFTIDPNSFRAIDWGDGDVSRFRITNLPLLKFGFLFSGKNLFNSTYDYRRFYGSFGGQTYVNSFLNFRYEIGGEVMTGQVPYQSLGYFNSRSGTIDIDNTFQATIYNEFRGDKIYYLNFQNNFGKLLWGGIPFLKNFNLITFFNAGRNEISEENLKLAAFKDFSISKGIYMEAGIGVSRILDIFRIDLAYRLNNPYNNGDRLFLNLSISDF